MAFAKTGDPNHPGIPEWKPSEADKEYVLVVDENTRILTNYDRELVPAAEKWLKAAMIKKMQEEKDQIQY
jgi:carboxylesterase type B